MVGGFLCVDPPEGSRHAEEWWAVGRRDWGTAVAPAEGRGQEWAGWGGMVASCLLLGSRPARRWRLRLYGSRSRSRALSSSAARRSARSTRRATSDTVATLIGLRVSYGLRASEALRLDIDDVDLVGDLPCLQIRRTKFRKSRLVPLHPTTAAALRNLRGATPPSRLRRPVQRSSYPNAAPDSTTTCSPERSCTWPAGSDCAGRLAGLAPDRQIRMEWTPFVLDVGPWG